MFSFKHKLNTKLMKNPKKKKTIYLFLNLKLTLKQEESKKWEQSHETANRLPNTM